MRKNSYSKLEKYMIVIPITIFMVLLLTGLVNNFVYAGVMELWIYNIVIFVSVLLGKVLTDMLFDKYNFSYEILLTGVGIVLSVILIVNLPRYTVDKARDIFSDYCDSKSNIYISKDVNTVLYRHNKLLVHRNYSFTVIEDNIRQEYMFDIYNGSITKIKKVY